MPTPQESPVPPTIHVEVSAGELLDKIAILEIKRSKFRDPAKLANVAGELGSLTAVRDRVVAMTPRLADLIAELHGVNSDLWEIEDELREHERRGAFDAQFVELARSVYHRNDRRAALKREINDLLHSRLVEEKGYADYAQRSESSRD